MQMCRDAKYCVSTIQQKTTFLKLDVVYVGSDLSEQCEFVAPTKI